MQYAIAVIDIGMTNKKVAIYDDKMQQLDAVYKNFDPVIETIPNSKETVEIHNLQGMKEWFFEQIAIFAKKYPIKGLSVSTHGATFVCIDENGNVSAPCVYYTHEPGEDFQKRFYKKVGTKAILQKETLTPPLGSMINLAKGIVFLQENYPAEIAKTKNILYYPQYWGYLLTGEKGVEPTFSGCHSYLWDHKNSTWSNVAEKLHISRLLPTNFKKTHEVLGTVKDDVAEQLGLEKGAIVTMGIHDSNAALLPYLATNQEKDFILNSTGTWCVSMHPQESYELEDEDIGKIVFFNQSALNKPVKTSIFLGGLELDTYVKLYKKINNTENFPSYSYDTVNAVLEELDTFLMPEVVPNSGQFSGSLSGIWEKGKFYSLKDIQSGKTIPSVMKKEQRFFAVLDLAMAFQSEVALKRIGLKKDTNIFTEGGFRKNKLYNELLANLLPENHVFTTNIEEASAFGAALTVGMSLSGKTLEEYGESTTISYKSIEAAPVNRLDNYKKRWLELATPSK